MASLANVEHRNQEATVYVGNLDALCDEDLLTELFVQVGRIQSVYMPKDKLTNQHNGYGFVEFTHPISADYAMTVLNNIKLYGRAIRVSKSSLEDNPRNNPMGLSSSNNVGANLFLGNLDPETVTEQLLYDTFVVFGPFARPPHLAKDEATGQSKGYGFASYQNFQASDTAIECMNGQYLGNRIIQVQYALKKDAEGRTTSERHGSRAERMLAAAAAAAQQRQQQHQQDERAVVFRPNTLFAGQVPPGSLPPPPPPLPAIMSAAGGVRIPPPPPPPPPPPLPSSLPMSMPPPPPPPPMMNIPPPPPPPPRPRN